MVTSQDKKHRVMLEFYENLLGTATPRDATLDLAFFHRQGVDLSALDALITESEVWDTIKKMPSDRAPGPDGVFFIRHVDLSSSMTSWQPS